MVYAHFSICAHFTCNVQVVFVQIIHKINMKFNEFLDEGNYSIPRLATGYKGDALPTFWVPQLRATRRDSGTEILPTAGENSSNDNAAAEIEPHGPDPARVGVLSPPRVHLCPIVHVKREHGGAEYLQEGRDRRRIR
jgi:hypothetical protein